MEKELAIYEKLINGIINEWEEDTGLLSYHDINHPAFAIVQKIDYKIVVPIVLKRIQKEPTWFFIILSLIVPEEEMPEMPYEIRGQFQDMIDVWTKWGKEKGMIE